MPTCRDLQSYIDVATSWAQAGTVWFRGVSNHRFGLIPSLYRLSVAKDDSFLALEGRLLARYKERALPFRDAANKATDDLATLFEMQHYGAPTRLLDWSENAIVALWFAVEDAEQIDRRGVVWAIDPIAWNRRALFHQGYTGGILAPFSPQVQALAPSASPTLMQNNPLCIYGLHNTPRIVSQRGVFTLAGKLKESLQAQEANSPSSSTAAATPVLASIEIPASSKMVIYDQLVSIGFTRSMIFPDLVGLASELREAARRRSL